MNDTINYAPQSEKITLQRELRGHEVLLWSDKIIPARSMYAGFALYLFAIPWTAFALFWESMALGTFFSENAKAPNDFEFWISIVFPLFGVPFILVGFGMLLAPFYAYAKAKKTICAITSERAIIFVDGRNKKIISYDLKTLGNSIERRENSKGEGYVYFDITKRKDGDGDIYKERIGLGPVRDVAHVEEKLRQAIQNTKE